MSLHRKLFLVIFVFTLLFNEPQMLRVYALEIRTEAMNKLENMDMVKKTAISFADLEEIHLAYALNGGTGNKNPFIIAKEDLPYTLSIPEREGYNFAGWYTDRACTDKITRIDQSIAKNMVLFAKWTKEIDNYYNVEMYTYRSGAIEGRNHKELRDCQYDFLDDLVIPGMPSTRERDYLEAMISSDAQCMQGLCFTPDYILMTAYAEEAQSSGSLMVFDRSSGEYLVTLRMREDSHLGGIAFDGDNVWVCHSSAKTLERIPYTTIRSMAKRSDRRCVDISEMTDEYRLKNIPSSITCYGGRIWVATHTKILDSQMRSYSYDEKSNQLSSVNSFRIPSKVQGIAFDADGTVYLSTSYGRNNSSYLKVYASLLTLTQSPNEPTMNVEMPPCAEQIAIADEHIYVIFESASRKYFEGTDGNGRARAPLDKVLEVAVASIW